MSADYSILGLCRKAGRLAVGHDAVIEAVRNGTAAQILLTSDASDRHKKEIAALNFPGETLFLPDTMDYVGFYTGKRCCIYAVTDAGFAASVKKKTGGTLAPPRITNDNR